jgi:hypothetical protein
VFSPSVSNSDDGTARQVVRAAQYVRMSTEHQKYSTENQADIIAQYAERRGFEVVRTYEDSGKSGLRLDGRQALQRHCQVEALQRRLGATGLGLMPRWSRCAIALPLLLGRCEASTGRQDGAGG